MYEFCAGCEDRGSELCSLPSRLERVAVTLAKGFSVTRAPGIWSPRHVFNEFNAEIARSYALHVEMDVMVCVEQHRNAELP